MIAGPHKNSLNRILESKKHMLLSRGGAATAPEVFLAKIWLGVGKNLGRGGLSNCN